MSLIAAQTAVVGTLAPLFPALRVEAHGGRFTEAELAILLGRTPCLLIAVLGFDTYASSGLHRWSASVSWGAYCLAADSATGRAELAMETVYALIERLPGQRWGLGAACKPPDMPTFAADNLYTGHANNLRIALWAASWSQTHHFEDSTP